MSARRMPLTGAARRAHEATDHRRRVPSCAECRRRNHRDRAARLVAAGKLVQG